MRAEGCVNALMRVQKLVAMETWVSFGTSLGDDSRTAQSQEQWKDRHVQVNSIGHLEIDTQEKTDET